jgi:HEAT repeat protein
LLYSTAKNNKEWTLSRSAVRALGNQNASWEVSIDIYRHSESPEVKIDAIQLINMRRDTSKEDKALIDSLSSLLANENDPQLRMVIVRQLGNSNSDHAVNRLYATAKNDGNKTVRSEAVSALRNINTTRTKELLLELLKIDESIPK